MLPVQAVTGLLTYVDRIKDCIRRRGENISATELEAAVSTLAGVAEVAACAVPSSTPGAENEILLSVVLAPDSTLTPQSIGEYADAVPPRFARPRFFEIVTDLPKTATGKLQRAVLSKSSVTRARPSR